MPWVLFELHLERVVVGIVVIGDDVKVLEVQIGAHVGRQHFVPQQIIAEIAHVRELKAAPLADVLLQRGIPHVDLRVLQVGIEGEDERVRRIEAEGNRSRSCGGKRICAVSAVEVVGTRVWEAKRALRALLVAESVEDTASASKNGLEVGALMYLVRNAETRGKVVLVRLPEFGAFRSKSNVGGIAEVGGSEERMAGVL